MFSEISLNILDIVQNSVSARASLIEITVNISNAEDTLTAVIKDNGCGMTESELTKVVDPFYTTGNNKSVGLGVSFFKMAAKLS
ncbi:MAG: ATP-binding protein, partial [Ruminiclostridium sp.]